MTRPVGNVSGTTDEPRTALKVRPTAGGQWEYIAFFPLGAQFGLAASEQAARDEAIGALIEYWHTDSVQNGELHEFLGMTWDEYAAWVER